MAKGTKERQPIIAGFVPGEVAEHFEVEEINDENSGKREVKIDCKSCDYSESIPVGFGDPLFWLRLGIHTAEHLAARPKREPAPKREPPPKRGGDKESSTTSTPAAG